MADGFILSSRDIAKIKAMAVSVRNKADVGVNYPDSRIDHEEMTTPEVYIALTPEGGIPPLVFDESDYHQDMPGYANCNLYGLYTDDVPPTIRPIQGLFRRIYNVFDVTLGGNRWVPVMRDKKGNWFATAIPFPEDDYPGTGTGSGTGSGTGTGTGTVEEEVFPDGDGSDPVVVIGPPLGCIDGMRPVQTARFYPVYDRSLQRYFLWGYDYETYTECCTDDCDDEAGTGTGTGTTGAGVTVPTGTGTVPVSETIDTVDGYCDTYTAFGVTLTRVGTRSKWRGGDYVLEKRKTAGNKWVLDNRGVVRTAPVCSWQISNWDGRECATFQRVIRQPACENTVDVCCAGDETVPDPPGDPGGIYTPCGRALNAMLYASLSGGYGTIGMAWNGMYWQGSKALSCGETLHLRLSSVGVADYSCNGVSWLNVLPEPIATCGPPATFTSFVVDMNALLAGCTVGACGSMSVTISE